MDREQRELMAQLLMGGNVNDIMKQKMKEKIIGKDVLRKINKSQNLLNKMHEVWSLENVEDD